MRGIEDMVEQNDNSFDGIINNVPAAPVPDFTEINEKADQEDIIADTKASVMEKIKEQQEKVKLALSLKQLPEGGETRTAVGMGNPATVKPPFVLSRISGKSALFGGAFQIGTPSDDLKPADVTLTRNGAAVELKAVFADGQTYVFGVDMDAASGKARLMRGKEGKLEAVLLSE